MTGGGACAACGFLRARISVVEMQLATALGDLDAASRDHARTLRHAASALHELQVQLQSAHERQGAAQQQLQLCEGELAAARRALSEYGGREEEGEDMKRAHEEAAEAFLQQVQALRSSMVRQVCCQCLGRMMEGGGAGIGD